ncbi:BTAD domain-containing putative transcriptional regulator [Streptomyces sp. NPDC001868]|uniref:AfsR/SARP family transcriptional regulator n=1 Tax=Streptomyces sp. NPDC001868 TaxID=3154401 RepID=UPI0033270F80
MPRNSTAQATAPGPPDAARCRLVTAQPTEHVALTLLGSFRLQIGQMEVCLPVSAQRLMVILALRGRQSRSRVAGTLWPESPESKALGNLRTGIWRVNQTAPGMVTGISGAIDLAAHVTVDVRVLVEQTKALLREAPPGASAVPEAVGDGGELLPDWDDEWLAHERERLRQLHLHLQETFAEQLAEQGKFGLALDVALGALRLDNLRESAHRSVIRIHLQEGNLSEARRAYATCRQVLEQELGVSPAPETTRILDRTDDHFEPTRIRRKVVQR